MDSFIYLTVSGDKFRIRTEGPDIKAERMWHGRWIDYPRDERRRWIWDEHFAPAIANLDSQAG